MALATILATKLSFDGWLEPRRTIGIIATEQAYQFGLGAEALAADVLNQIKRILAARFAYPSRASWAYFECQAGRCWEPESLRRLLIGPG